VKIYVIYCMTLVAVAAFRIRLDATRVSICKTLRGFASTIVFSNNTENPGILALLSFSNVLALLLYPGSLDVSQSSGLDPPSKCSNMERQHT
jgi:hypothetical protein